MDVFVTLRQWGNAFKDQWSKITPIPLIYLAYSGYARQVLAQRRCGNRCLRTIVADIRKNCSLAPIFLRLLYYVSSSNAPATTCYDMRSCC